MQKKDVYSMLWEISESCVKPLGYEVYDVEYVKEGQDFYIRFFIDKEGGISSSDCEIVNRKIDKLLDERDPIDHPYILEVSSCGIDRALKREEHFVKYIGSKVEIKLFKGLNKQKIFVGDLIEFENSIVKIKDDTGNEFSFALKEIASCRLFFTF